MNKWRNDFPILKQTNRSKPLIYLDSSASSQKPRQVVEAIANYYYNDHANIHRGVYELSERATNAYDAAREITKDFIHAASACEIVFVRGTTEAINLIAQSMRQSHFKSGDEIILSEMEHHSNIVPWYMLREQIGVVLRIIPVDDSGVLDLDAYQKLFSTRTKMVAVTHASNVLGTLNPIKEMAQLAHAREAPILVDGAQAVPHLPVDVQALDCDFYAFSAHKAYGPTGVGVLYGKQSWLNKLPPYQGGGAMIEAVSFENISYAPLPHKFEAGTPDIANVIGLGVALKYLQTITMEAVFAHDQSLLLYATQQLRDIAKLRLIGCAKDKVGVISFVIDDLHPHDIATVLDHEGIAVRAGHHCAMPLVNRFGVPATVRASLGLYNDEADIDALVQALYSAKKVLS